LSGTVNSAFVRDRFGAANRCADRLNPQAKAGIPDRTPNSDDQPGAAARGRQPYDGPGEECNPTTQTSEQNFSGQFVEFRFCRSSL